MTRCAKCGRSLKRPSASGFGPVCERAVLGSKQRREAKPEVKRDALTRELFPEQVAA